MALVNRGAFASPPADAGNYVFPALQEGLATQVLSSFSWWQIAVMVLLSLVMYDQGMPTHTAQDIRGLC